MAVVAEVATIRSSIGSFSTFVRMMVSFFSTHGKNVIAKIGETVVVFRFRGAFWGDTIVAHIAAFRSMVCDFSASIWRMFGFTTLFENVIAKVGETVIVFRLTGHHFSGAIQAIVAAISRKICPFPTET
jgi:hypothetical protein